MNKIGHLLFPLLLISLSSLAQTSSNLAEVSALPAPAVNNWSMSAGEMRIYEPTLSPQQYKGWSLGFRGEHFNLYRKTTSVEWLFRDRFRYANLINASSSARMQYLSADLSFGSHYIFRPLRDFDIRLGGALQLYGDIKYVSRNFNNIASGNVSVNFLATLSLSYDALLTPKFRLGASYSLESPLIGCRFAPRYGESYYEIYLRLPDLKQNVTFSSLHNHQALAGSLRLNLTFLDRGTLFLAFTHDHDYFHFSRSIFYVYELSGSIGFALRLSPVSLK